MLALANERGIELRAILVTIFIFTLLGCASTHEVLKENSDIPSSMMPTFKLAKAGDAPSQELIGEMYHFGKKEVLKSYEKAFYWYNLAAHQGLASSQDYLGLMYAGGLGTIEDCGKSIKWFKFAHRNGYKQSRSNLVWTLATCSDDSKRDGELALKLIKEDIREYGASIGRLDNFAAALAETGEFEHAVKIQTKLVKILKNRKNKTNLLEFQKRIQFYKQKKAWRKASYRSPEDYSK